MKFKPVLLFHKYEKKFILLGIQSEFTKVRTVDQIKSDHLHKWFLQVQRYSKRFWAIHINHSSSGLEKENFLHYQKYQSEYVHVTLATQDISFRGQETKFIMQSFISPRFQAKKVSVNLQKIYFQKSLNKKIYLDEDVWHFLLLGLIQNVDKLFVGKRQH